MSAMINRQRAALGRPCTAIAGIVPCSTEHRILLALRGSPLLQEQITARFSSPYGPLHRLTMLGLVAKPPAGKKGEEVRLTEAGRALLEQHPGLSRRSTEIIYCQL